MMLQLKASPPLIVEQFIWLTIYAGAPSTDLQSLSLMHTELCAAALLTLIEYYMQPGMYGGMSS